ncbi:MAG: hypothetical protein WCF24_06785 [Acidimicrobiales bacterium]
MTWTVSVAAVLDVGVPVNTPFEARVTPSGGDPAITDHVYGPTPPAAVTRAEYGMPYPASGSDVDVILSAETIWNAPVYVQLADFDESVRVTVALPAERSGT